LGVDVGEGWEVVVLLLARRVVAVVAVDEVFGESADVETLDVRVVVDELP
jgi:hypothetical protein